MAGSHIEIPSQIDLPLSGAYLRRSARRSARTWSAAVLGVWRAVVARTARRHADPRPVRVPPPSRPSSPPPSYLLVRYGYRQGSTRHGS